MSQPDRVNSKARVALYEEIAERFISPKVRRSRVEVAYTMQGFKTMSAFAAENGMYPAAVTKVMDSPRPSIIGIYRLAVALNVSINYLTEVDYFKKKDKEDA